MVEEGVTLEYDERGIAVLTLNRPERRNALSLELIAVLLRCLDELDENRAVRVIVLASTGTVFSSGHDLKEIANPRDFEQEQIFSLCIDLVTRLQRFRVPVIAEVQGPAVAAGCQLVASCDLAVASEQALFSTPGVRIGLFCTTPMVPLSRTIGPKRALEMLYTGKAIDARTAERWGLVNYVVSLDQLRSTTWELALQIAQVSPAAIKSGKQAFFSELDLSYCDAYQDARLRMVHDAKTPDAIEGVDAFLSKRKPQWPSGSSEEPSCIGEG